MIRTKPSSATKRSHITKIAASLLAMGMLTSAASAGRLGASFGVLTAGAAPATTQTQPPTPRTQPRYDYPDGAMAVDLTLDGRPVLAGACAEINGTIYVPVARFVDLCGDFRVTYTAAPEEVVVEGKNLYVRVAVGDPYITVNGRILYTGAPVLSLRGWIFAPLSSLATAMNARLTVFPGWYRASLVSGDPSRVPSADQLYDGTDLYWLSRIISAEARGESLQGQIAVGNVVLNRVRDRDFPNTVKDVIFDRVFGVQFSPVANGTIYQAPTDSAILAARICLEGYTISPRALYFFNPAIATSTWIARSRPYLMTIGHHAFYA